MGREFDVEVNAFGCRRCGNEDADKIEAVVEFVGTKPSGLIGHPHRFAGYRCLVCEPKRKTS